MWWQKVRRDTTDASPLGAEQAVDGGTRRLRTMAEPHNRRTGREGMLAGVEGRGSGSYAALRTKATRRVRG